MADDKKLNITGEVKIDQTKATSDLEALTAELGSFRSALEKNATGVELILRSLANMAKSMEESAADSKAAAQASKAEADAKEKAATAAAAVAKATSASATAMKVEATAAKAAAEAADHLGKETAESAKETEKLPGFWKSVLNEGVAGVLDGMQQATKETGKLSAKTEVVRGIWQRMGHKIFDGIISGLKSVVGYFGDLAGSANAVNVIFNTMSATGVKNVKALKDQVTELAGVLGEDLVEVAKSVQLAESLGAGTAAVKVAEAAWKNYQVTGMDVTRQIELTTRISRSFNAAVGEQSKLINAVATAAQKAHISQDALWEGVASVAPKVQQLGGSFRDLVNLTTTGLAQGLKAGENGLQGMEDLLNNLINPSKQFGEALVELGVISTNSSPKWKQLKEDIQGQTGAFTELVAKVSEYKREATEIGLLTAKTDALLESYNALNAKVQSGTESPRERSQFRDMTRELENRSEALSKYDKIGGIVENREFRSLGLGEQVRQRIESAGKAQADLTLKSQEAQLAIDDMNSSLGTMQTEFSNLTEKLQNEVPQAIQTAISSGGLGAFITELSGLPTALNALPATVQTLVSTLGPALSGPAQQVATDVGSITAQFNSLEQAGTDGFNKLKTSIATISTTIFEPFRQALDVVAAEIRTKLEAPFKDGGESMYAAVSKWSSDTAASITKTLTDAMNGDITVGQAMSDLFNRAIEEIKRIWKEYIGPMMEEFIAQIKEKIPSIEAQLQQAFSAMGNKAGQAFRDGILGDEDGNMLSRIGLGMDYFSGKLGGAIGGYFDNVAGNINAGAAGSGYSPQDTGGSRGVGAPAGRAAPSFVINGATDPMAVAREVSRTISQQERLGYSGDRLR